MGQNECAAAHSELIPNVNPLSFAGSERPNSGLRFNAVERLGGRRPSFLSAAVCTYPPRLHATSRPSFKRPLRISILWTHFRVGSTLPSAIARPVLVSVDLSQATLQFINVSVESRRKCRANLFVQSPELVDGHLCKVFIVHTRLLSSFRQKVSMEVKNCNRHQLNGSQNEKA